MDSDDTRQILCERCRKFVPITDMKYVPKGNESRMALCKNCLASFNTEAAKKKKQADEVRAKLKRSAYFCSRCRYKFKYDPGSNASLRCPYCGKADKIMETEQIDAESLLKNAED
ncbi:MAG: hypothetical protein V1866_04340 [archaeon]